MKISHPDKVFYPGDGLTKGDVVEHYRTVASPMLPHLRGRPLTLRRYPDGIEAEGWFQKHPSEHFPSWLRTARVPRRGGGTDEYVVCDDEDSLLYLASQATVEFHVWLSTMDAPDKPDLLVLDLDPPEGTDVADLRTAARRIRDHYAEAGLVAYLQATGGRGFHVVAPLDATASTDVVLKLSRALADRVASADPDRLTTAQRKDQRGDRVFVDANRNGYAQTFVAPYSLRARPGAASATPLDWAELGKADSNGWGPAKLARRLARKDDPWRGMREDAGSAEKALKALA
ncbi:non-homologous end-joining DNA ligase [Amycolatopsis benzoatilytica]|uniref:non-homologous end-joining DNA ligase n=1 Tax=Amycolatopsis benzoatilytica TaxID=346045 RepID=UPI00037F2C5A|nr:non-homologous end-joining DNA ligase [Amycolatopsis benzoatilytica]